MVVVVDGSRFIDESVASDARRGSQLRRLLGILLVLALVLAPGLCLALGPCLVVRVLVLASPNMLAGIGVVGAVLASVPSDGVAVDNDARGDCKRDSEDSCRRQKGQLHICTLTSRDIRDAYACFVPSFSKLYILMTAADVLLSCVFVSSVGIAFLAVSVLYPYRLLADEVPSFLDVIAFRCSIFVSSTICVSYVASDR